MLLLNLFISWSALAAPSVTIPNPVDWQSYGWLLGPIVDSPRREAVSMWALRSWKYRLLQRAIHLGVVSRSEIVAAKEEALGRALTNAAQIDAAVAEFSQVISGDMAIDLLSHSQFVPERRALIWQIREMEDAISKFQSYWIDEIGERPGWIDWRGQTGLESIFDSHVYGFESVSQEYMIDHGAEFSASADHATRRLYWSSGLFRWLSSRLDVSPHDLELQEMTRGFVETLREQGLPKFLQFQFLELLTQLQQNPQNLDDLTFVRTLLSRRGPQFLAGFNAYFELFMKRASSDCHSMIESWVCAADPGRKLHAERESDCARQLEAAAGDSADLPTPDWNR